MVAEEVRLLKTLVSDLEKELKTKGEYPVSPYVSSGSESNTRVVFCSQSMRTQSWKPRYEAYREN